MQYFTTASKASHRAADCIVVGVYARGRLGAAATDVDQASGGAIGHLVKQGDITGQPGTCLLLTNVAGVRAKRVLVVGLGKFSEFGVSRFRSALGLATERIRNSKAQSIVNFLTLEEVDGSSSYYLARYTVETITSHLYTFSQMKSKRGKSSALKKIGIAIAGRGDATKSMLGAEHGGALASGVNLARDLGNLPPNVCTPAYLARVAQRLAREHTKLQTRVLGEAEIKRLDMNSFLSVTAGTSEPAKLIVMQYKGAAGQKPVVLVGKGITFDAGGISLKPPPSMDEMKFDMCGAASVIAAISVAAKLKLPINVTVIVPTCENLPGSNATRPGDIVKSMSGKTIEILNTDAEGRLILCDALTYAKRFKPGIMIDVATLTGACVIALGHFRTAVMSNSDDLATALVAAGNAADDRCWHMPMADEYERQLRSNFADFANVGGREGGAITAACFLGKFTEGIDWAHMDIAGTAWTSGTKKGATGRPVPMLSELLLRRAGAVP